MENDHQQIKESKTTLNDPNPETTLNIDFLDTKNYIDDEPDIAFYLPSKLLSQLSNGDKLNIEFEITKKQQTPNDQNQLSLKNNTICSSNDKSKVLKLLSLKAVTKPSFNNLQMPKGFSSEKIPNTVIDILNYNRKHSSDHSLDLHEQEKVDNNEIKLVYSSPKNTFVKMNFGNKNLKYSNVQSSTSPVTSMTFNPPNLNFKGRVIETSKSVIKNLEIIKNKINRNQKNASVKTDQDFQPEFLISQSTTIKNVFDYKPMQIYELWNGNNQFCNNGKLVTGPRSNWKKKWATWIYIFVTFILYL